MPVPTTRTLIALRQDLLSRISENNNSTVGQLPSGTDGVPIEDTIQACTRYLNEAARKLARAAYPIMGVATLSGAANATDFLFNAFSTLDGSGLWVARTVKVGSTLVRRASRSYADINTTSTTQNWVPNGSTGISLTQALTGTTTITVSGFVVPPPLVLDTDAPTWLEPDLDYALVYYAAGMMCMKAKSVDPNLGAMADMWMNEYAKVEAMQNARLKANDLPLWQAHFQYAPMTGK